MFGWGERAAATRQHVEKLRYLIAILKVNLDSMSEQEFLNYYRNRHDSQNLLALRRCSSLPVLRISPTGWYDIDVKFAHSGHEARLSLHGGGDAYGIGIFLVCGQETAYVAFELPYGQAPSHKAKAIMKAFFALPDFSAF